MKLLRNLLLTGLALIALAACRSEWVQLTEAGESVTVAQAGEVADCERVGRTTVNSRDSIGFIDRSARQVQNELVRLARNEAADMNANRIVPESTIDDGRQTFAAYRCPR